MRNLLVILILIALLYAGYLFLLPKGFSYDSPAYGISFAYPFTYNLSEGEKGNGERDHYAIVLTRKGDTVRPANGEGPTAITIDVYQNNIDDLTLQEWLEQSSFSNYKFSDHVVTNTSIGTEEAVSYRWSGLYEGRTTAFRHKGNIIAVSVTFQSPLDSHLTAYVNLLKSITLK